jgi:hypothetical protein
VGHGNGTTRREVVSQLPRAVGLEDVNGIRGYVSGHVPLALVRGLRRSVDVHHQMADGVSIAELDLGMPSAHAGETIDTVDNDGVTTAAHALYRDGVTAEARNEPIPLFRLGRAAGDGREREE